MTLAHATSIPHQLNLQEFLTTLLAPALPPSGWTQHSSSVTPFSLCSIFYLVAVFFLLIFNSSSQSCVICTLQIILRKAVAYLP